MTSLSLYSKGWLLALPMLILATGTAAAQQPDSLRGDDPTLRSVRIQDGAVFIDGRRVLSDEKLPKGFSLNDPTLRSFRIEGDGTVFIDGRKVSPDKLPEGFPPEGVSAYYMFSPGLDADLKIQIEGGKQYVLKGDTLELHTSPDAELDVSDYFRGKYPPGAPSVLILPTPPVLPEAILLQKADDLREQARRLQDLQNRFDESQTNELQQMLEEMAMHAAEAARTASEFPHIQMQHYLSDIQNNNKGLFDQLMNERLMEHETMSMARKFAAMEEGKARRDSIAVLRERLTEIFELKQENRRREVEQLEEKLQELQKAVAERERLSGEIVDRRLQELLGNDTLDW